MGLEPVPSAANFILVRVGDGQRVFNELQKHGVIVRPLGGYQLPEWIRVSVGTPEENSRCLATLKNIFALVKRSMKINVESRRKPTTYSDELTNNLK